MSLTVSMYDDASEGWTEKAFRAAVRAGNLGADEADGTGDRLQAVADRYGMAPADLLSALRDVVRERDAEDKRDEMERQREGY